MRAAILIPSLVALSVLAGSSPVHARSGPVVVPAPTGTFEISTVPYEIRRPGTYILTRDLTIDGWSVTAPAAISVKASNVVIDLNGHRIVQTQLFPLTGVFYGVTAVDQASVTVRNGTLVKFPQAISLRTTDPVRHGGHAVERMRVDSSEVRAIAVEGHSAVVRGNVVTRTGQGMPTADGIRVSRAAGARILDNDIAAVRAETVPPRTYGIVVAQSQNALVVGNRITDVRNGIVFESSTGKYRDNLTSGVTNAYAGGTDAGNNN